MSDKPLREPRVVEITNESRDSSAYIENIRAESFTALSSQGPIATTESEHDDATAEQETPSASLTEERIYSANTSKFRRRSSEGGSVVDLLASVLEQRYSTARIEYDQAQETAPDPLSFPAVQKALGTFYSAFVEEEEERAAAAPPPPQPYAVHSESQQSKATLEEAVDEMSQELFSIIEQGAANAAEEAAAIDSFYAPRPSNIPKDPYNRAINIVPAPIDDDIPEIPSPPAYFAPSEIRRRRNIKRNGESGDEE